MVSSADPASEKEGEFLTEPYGVQGPVPWWESWKILYFRTQFARFGASFFANIILKISSPISNKNVEYLFFLNHDRPVWK